MAEERSSVVADGADDLDVEWRLKFWRLPRYAFDDLAKWASDRGLNIRSGHVAGEMRFIDGELRLQPMVTLAGLIAKAHATGVYGGSRVVKEHFDKDGKLVWVEAVAKRKIGGEWERFRQRAYLETYYPGPGINSFWEPGSGQVQQLGKCGRALAIKDAFDFADLLTVDEMDQQLTRPQRQRSTAPAREESRETPVKEEDLPQTRQQLHMSLIEWGVKDEKARDKVLAEFRAKWRAADDDSPAFYMNVFLAFTKEPARFGGKRPAAA